MEHLFEKFNKKIEGIEINAENIMTLLKHAMEVVELSQMKGSEQKETVLKFLTLAIKNAEFQEELEEEYLNMVKNGVMATTIDIIVDATKGKLHVNKNVKKAKGFLISFRNFINKLVSCYRKIK